MDIQTELAQTMQVIKADPQLKAAFVKILDGDTATRKTRLQKLRLWLEDQDPPAEVTRLLYLLHDSQIADQVYSQLTDSTSST